MCNGKTKHLWCVEIANTSDYTDSPLILHPAVWKSLSLRLKSYLINKNSLLPPHLHIFLRNVICQAMQTFLFSLACKSEVAGSSILHCRGAPLSHIYIYPRAYCLCLICITNKMIILRQIHLNNLCVSSLLSGQPSDPEDLLRGVICHWRRLQKKKGPEGLGWRRWGWRRSNLHL